MRLEDHVVAGYFLTAPGERLEVQVGARARRAVTACSSLGQFAPDTWCLDWATDRGSRASDQAKALGIDPARVPSLTAWFTKRMSDGQAFFPHFLARLDDARRFRALAASRRKDLETVGVALPRSEVESFLEVTKAPAPTPGFRPGETGAATALRRGASPAAGGEPLGYEPLVQPGWATGWTSWLATNEDAAVARELGIHADERGLLAHLETATRVCRWLDEHGDKDAKPGTWFPWLLIRYDAGVERPGS